MEISSHNREDSRQDGLDTPAAAAERQVQFRDGHIVQTDTTASTSVSFLRGEILEDGDTAQSPNPIVAKWALEMRTLTDEQRERFLKEVPDGDLNKFANSIEEIITQRIKSSRTLQVANAMAPLGQLVDMTKPFADTVRSAFPPAGLILGGISLLLSITKKFADYQESVVLFLQKVLTNHKLFERFRTTIPETTEIQLILIEIYGDLLKFLAAAVKPFIDKKGRARMTLVPVAKSLWKPFDAEFGNLEKHLDNHLSAFDRALLLHSQKEQTTMSKLQGRTYEMIQGADQRRSLFEKQSGVKETAKEQEELRKEILGWIPHSSFDHIQDDKHSNSLSTTGRWLFDHDSFRTWKDGGPSNILWITGKAGSGKSHLAAHTIHNIRESCRVRAPLLVGDQDDKAHALAFIYCSSNANAKTSSGSVPIISALLGSLLRQLYAQLPRDKNVETIRNRYMDSKFDGLRRAEIKDGIRSVVRDFSRVYMIVDGLDECSGLPGDDFNDLCQFFGSLAAKELANSARVVIFSRPGYSAITSALPNPLGIQVDDGSNANDIKTFIQERTVDMTKKPSALQQIRNNLLDGAEGVFLWVSLSIKIIELETSDRAKMAAAQNTWQGLGGSLKALLWIANSQEPLSKEELIHALSFEPGMESLNSDDIIDEKVILPSCSDLLVKKHDQYELLHFSLAEFLRSEAASEILHSKHPWGKDDEPDAVLASLCMGYLLLDEFKRGPIDTWKGFKNLVKRFPLLRHAALHWGTYLQRSIGPENTSLACDVLRRSKTRNLAMQALAIYTKRGHSSIFPWPGSARILHVIAAFGLEELLRWFPEALTQINLPDGFLLYPIDYAILRKHKAMAMWLLSRGKVFKSQPTESNSDRNEATTQPLNHHVSLVPEAAKNRWPGMVSSLIAAGFDKDAKDRTCNTAWHHAAHHGDLDTAGVLIKSGANPNTKNRFELTPLIAAARWADITMLQRLLDCGADANIQTSKGTALHELAMRTEDNTAAGMIRFLCEHGADTEKLDQNGCTPLLFAARLDNIAALEALLSKGAHLAARNRDQSNVLHIASAHGSLKVLKFLLTDRNAGKIEPRAFAMQKDDRDTSPDPLNGRPGRNPVADINSLCCADNNGWWPLHSAVVSEKIECAEYICNFDSDQINKQDLDGFTPLHFAVVSSQVLMIDFLLDRGADINNIYGPAKNLVSPLHLAMRGQPLEVAAALLKRGADPNLENMDGTSAWDFAAMWGDQTTMRFVLDNDSVLREDEDRLRRLLEAAIDHQNIEVFTLLLSPYGQHSLLSKAELPRNCGLWAIQSGSREIWQMLVFRDSSLATATDPDGAGTLHYAAMYGRTNLMSQMCEMDIDFNQTGFCNRSPLIYAARSNMPSMVKLLCDKGVDVNHTDSYGRTALHYSSGTGCRNAMESLLQAGADVRIRDITGFTAAEYAPSSISMLRGGGTEGLQYFNVDFCSSCHTIFTREGQGAQQELYTLEYALRSVRRALFDVSQFGINILLRILDSVTALWGYFQEKEKQYRNWFKRYNPEARCEQLTPGWILVRTVIKLKGLSESGGNGEGTAGALGRTVRVVAGSDERELTYSFRYLNGKCSPAWENPHITAGSSHQFLKVCSLEELPDEDRVFFDEEGTLSNSFLERLGETIANLDINQVSTDTEHKSGSWPLETTMNLTYPSEPSRENIERPLPDNPGPAQAPNDSRQTGHDEENSDNPLGLSGESGGTSTFKIDVDEVRESLTQKMRRLQPDDDSLMRGEGFVLETAWSLVQAVVYGDEARCPPLVELIRESGESEGDRVQTD
ncbi:hypothetical protein PG993_012639 [Apiospora rasikravindrae]|uniref:Nephrocystin 3-like N-terminal domain-containing protein n=1 Tax=Apiospora rasikravindrae TaxID=990691 RepID=A0ABR1S363_9PEZI